MNLFKSRSVLGFALALGTGSLPAMAQAAPAPQMAPHDWTQGRLAERLKLTDAQKSSIREITAEHQAALAAKGKAAREARQAFFEALDKPDTSADSLKALHRAMTDLGFEQLMEARAMRLETRAVLLPEQREMAARMEGRKEGMRMAGGGMRSMHDMHHGPDGAALPPAATPPAP